MTILDQCYDQVSTLLPHIFSQSRTGVLIALMFEQNKFTIFSNRRPCILLHFLIYHTSFVKVRATFPKPIIDRFFISIVENHIFVELEFRRIP